MPTYPASPMTSRRAEWIWRQLSRGPGGAFALTVQLANSITQSGDRE